MTTRLSGTDLEKAKLADLGLTEPALARFIRAAYSLLDLISYFTVGEDEVRAWTIRRGTNARRAAGRIHSDLERGFIRAEVMNWNDLVTLGSEAAVPLGNGAGGVASFDEQALPCEQLRVGFAAGAYGLRRYVPVLGDEGAHLALQRAVFLGVAEVHMCLRQRGLALSLPG